MRISDWSSDVCSSDLAVVGDVHLAVLERAHRARVDVDVWIELHHRHAQAARLEDGRQGSRGNALAEGGHHAAGDENERGDGARGGHGIGRSLDIRILPVRSVPGSLSAEKSGFRAVASRGPRRKTRRQTGAWVYHEHGR